MTTFGHDNCGNPCTKTGPAQCFTVHPACLNSSPGTPTDALTCETPTGNYDCGLSCEVRPNSTNPPCLCDQWANNIGADCTNCINISCVGASGKDRAKFRCNNLPAAPTP
jgi:hypothetical protein